VSAAALSRARRRRRLWLPLLLAVIVALVTYLVLHAAGCFAAPPLDVTVVIHNTGAAALTSLSLDQVDGPAHAIVPAIAAGASVTVRVKADDTFRGSKLDLVDDATGRNYALPPYHFKDSLHGTIEVEASRPGSGAALEGRARSHTDSGADPRGWEPLHPD
jgi:hypothetical protein